MVDESTLMWARSASEYKVTPMRTSDGKIAPHYLDEISHHGFDFDELMKDAMFARIIGCELEAERIANAPLDALAEHAPDKRIQDFYLRWLAFMNADLQPWTTGGAIHFRPHWARVLMLALALGDVRGLADADMEALAMAAIFHDSRRKNPYLDTGHGARAAKYYLQFCRENQEGALRRTPAGRKIRFDPRAYLVIRWHDRHDGCGFEAIGRALCENRLPEAGIEDLQAATLAAIGAPATSADIADLEDILRIFKDADALDRVRLGGMDHGGLDVRYLRTPEALDLVPYAHTLLHAVESAEQAS